MESSFWSLIEANDYSEVTGTSAGLPLARCGHGILSDDNNIFILGGLAHDLLSDCWVFNLASRIWSQLKQDSISPSPFPRTSFSVAKAPTSDPNIPGDNLLGYLYGGSDGSSLFSDLWRIYCVNESISFAQIQFKDGYSPSPRIDHAMAVSDKLVLLHGGENDVFFDDAWFLDVNNFRWDTVNIANTSQRPCGRSKHSLAFCSSTYSFLLFGGQASSHSADIISRETVTLTQEEVEYSDTSDNESDVVPLNDMWVLSAVNKEENLWNWNLIVLDCIGPSPRFSSAFVSSKNYVYLFGGYGYVEQPSQYSEEDEEEVTIISAYLDDLWMLSPDLSNWISEFSLGYCDESPLEGRSGHSLSMCGNLLVLYGGFVGDGFDGNIYTANVGNLETLAKNSMDVIDTYSNSDEFNSS